MASCLSGRLAAVEARIAAACARAGRARQDVRLVGVTKGKDASVVRAGVAAGLRCFGENYAQEWTAKRAALADVGGIEWHFIGRIQRNKAAMVAAADLVHSVADARVARALDAAGVRRGVPVSLLIQVNLDDETTKDGVAPAELPELVRTVRAYEGLRLVGLMAIPAVAAPERVRSRFRALRELRDRQDDAAGLRELSMGMSGDFEVAIEEGATLVRIGTAIFGSRERTT
ncbi:MAG: YggS family pyridoxal phosphate-dependent enzyme [Deltaproteobacteria bacterium]|nr:YggS family pyridoxal phosphate-dependent enzyme [Deltaproteobacteria bacterium]